MNNKAAIKAMFHHYFATAILNKIDSMDTSIGDIFDIGEDAFVIELYPYSKAIYKAVVKDKHWVDSNIFQLVEDLADFFIAASSSSLPEIDHFELDIERVLLSL